MKLKFLPFTFIIFLIFCSSNEQVTSNSTANTKLFEKQILQHPRLLFTAEEEQNIKDLSKTDPLLGDLLQLLKKEADELLYAPLIDAPNNLTKSREHVYRVITLGTAYRMFDDEVYAHRLEKILINLSNYKSWNPDHYLDVAETTAAVAIGYDWLYDFLSDESKNIIEDAIIQKALNLALPVYEENNNDGSWAKRETNWNVVCNTGMTMGAIAIAQRNPVLSEKIIRYAAEFVPNCLKHYSPDGVCYEGPAYWQYTNIYLAMLLKTFDDNLKNDFGISELPGVSNTANFYVQSLSPTKKVFNFANTSANASSADSPIFYYFGNRFNQPSVIDYYNNKLTNIVEGNINQPKWHFFLSIAWYKDKVKPQPAVFPKLQVFKNEYNPIVAFNGDRSKEGSIYLTAKGGDPDEAHQQLDGGSFIIESDGIKWTDDTGSDNYSLPGFWDYKPEGRRWNYFRNTNFSHNTISIDNKLQHSAGKGILTDYKTDGEIPYSTFDLTSLYKDQAETMRRGFKLLDDKVILIQDEITSTSDNQEVCWSIITKAEIKIDGNNVILSKDGKTFYLKVVAPSVVAIHSEVAKNMLEIENPLTGYNLLKVTTKTGSLKNRPLQILAGSDEELINKFSENQYESFSQWN
ncbi:MAG TPA: heparinase II/III family protein [Fermentimonas sp.]|nr:heparinase II/III family protein [Fermentimonas sp.]